MQHTIDVNNKEEVNAQISDHGNRTVNNLMKFFKDEAVISLWFYDYPYADEWDQYPQAEVDNKTVVVTAWNNEFSRFAYDLVIESKFDNITFPEMSFFVNGELHGFGVLDSKDSFHGIDVPIGISDIELIIKTNSSRSISIEFKAEVKIKDFTAPNIMVDSYYEIDSISSGDTIEVENINDEDQYELWFYVKVEEYHSRLRYYDIKLDNSTILSLELTEKSINRNEYLNVTLGSHSFIFSATDEFGYTEELLFYITLSDANAAKQPLNLDFPSKYLIFSVFVILIFKIRQKSL